jgi:thiamine-phosphate diphosphorylase
MLDRLHLCVITDVMSARGYDHVAIAEAALAGGADMIQLRDKTGNLRDLLPQARAIQARCRARGAVFIVNDRVDLALAADADGAHVGQEDLPAACARLLLGPKRLLGVSTHDPGQAEAAQRAGADYIGFGPMFATGTKDTGYTPRGVDASANSQSWRFPSWPSGHAFRRRGTQPRHSPAVIRRWWGRDITATAVAPTESGGGQKV